MFAWWGDNHNTDVLMRFPVSRDEYRLLHPTETA